MNMDQNMRHVQAVREFKLIKLSHTKSEAPAGTRPSAAPPIYFGKRARISN